MTCIVGIATGSDVVMGGDSAALDGWTHNPCAHPKVFELGPYVIGFTTSFRMGQLLRYSLDVPAPPTDGAALHRFLCTTFVDALRDCFKAGGWSEKDKEKESGGQFLVGVRGRLFMVDPGYAVLEPARGFAAVGVGDSFAMGSLATALVRTAEERVREALSVAAECSAGVRAPFVVVRGGGTR